MRWSQPYGGGFLANDRERDKNVILATDVGRGKLNTAREMLGTLPTAPCHFSDRALDNIRRQGISFSEKFHFFDAPLF
jgi:hypothetical protein